MEPLEDLDDLSKSANPALLQLLCQVMVKAGFDLREFQRVLFNSRTYQAKSSVTPEIGKSEQYLFPGPVLRRMTAEQTWDSILALVIGEKLDDYKIDRSHRVTRYQFPFDQMSDSEVTKMVLSMKKSGHLTKGNGSRLNELDYVNGKRPLKIGSQFLLRASEMQQPAKDDHFLRLFGQSSSGGLRPAVEFLFLSFFGRPPTPDEFEAIEESLRSGMKKEDLTWALFNSTEFLFVQ